MKGNSEALNIDPNFIVIQGYSSGGHLACLMGATSGLSKFSYQGEEIDLNGDLGHLNQNSDVYAVIDWNGPLDLLRIDDCPKIKRKKRN